MPVLKQNEVFAGRYLLNQLIGEGGFSEVWMAEDQMADNAVVAIKVYAPGKGLDDYSLHQSRNEFSLTYNLSHPHLLKVNHFDVADGSPYLIMTYCPFGSLAALLKKEGVFSEKQVALVMCQIGSALEEIHRQDPPIIHQDIKPDNILLLHPESFMLADFGISSRIRSTLGKTSADIHALTVAYAPPERFDHHCEASPASDIFSLGVTLYEMCTNTVPWDGAGGKCLLKEASVPALPDSIDPELKEILEACIAVDKSKRPTAAELHIKGRQFLETGQWHLPKKRKWVLPMNASLGSVRTAAAIALFAVAGFGFYKVQNKHAAVKPQAVTTSSVIESKSLNPPKEEPKAEVVQLIQESKRPKQQKPENQLVVQKREPQVAKTQEPLAKKAGALPATQRSGKSRVEAKPAFSKKPAKAKKPLFKRNTKNNKKGKPRKRWVKKLKRRLSL